MKREPPKGDGWTTIESRTQGFVLRHTSGLQVIATYGGGWDHVSVSRKDRIPTWEEMCMVKDTLFSSDETVIQYHPAKSKYVNLHERCLHLWRPQAVHIPTPPIEMV